VCLVVGGCYVGPGGTEGAGSERAVGAGETLEAFTLVKKTSRKEGRVRMAFDRNEEEKSEGSEEK
jgi:hypothetical protein